MKNLKINRWAIAIIIGMAGGLSFELPYLKVNFQPEMQASLAFIMATYPSFPVLVAIQMVWAVTTILFMWSATIKAVSLLGNADEQGGLMGIAEGVRGFSCLIAGVITLGIFKKLGADTNPDAFKGVIIGYGIFLSRGMYFATIGELHTPKRIVGTTVGVISLIGFLPDAFIYMVIGHWQDTLPAAEAYRNLWLTGAFGTALGIVMSTLLLRELKKIKARAEEAA